MTYRDDFNNVYSESKWTVKRIFWGLLWFVVLIAAFGFITGVMALPGQLAGRVANPDRIISNYEQYYRMYEGIQGNVTKLTVLETQLNEFSAQLPEDRNSWTKEDRKEYNRINSDLTGIRTIIQDQIAQYNAQSQMITRNLWKSNDLPHTLTWDHFTQTTH